jgi:hypothetical protein
MKVGKAHHERKSDRGKVGRNPRSGFRRTSPPVFRYVDGATGRFTCGGSALRYPGLRRASKVGRNPRSGFRRTSPPVFRYVDGATGGFTCGGSALRAPIFPSRSPPDRGPGQAHYEWKSDRGKVGRNPRSSFRRTNSHVFGIVDCATGGFTCGGSALRVPIFPVSRFSLAVRPRIGAGSAHHERKSDRGKVGRKPRSGFRRKSPPVFRFVDGATGGFTCGGSALRYPGLRRASHWSS